MSNLPQGLPPQRQPQQASEIRVRQHTALQLPFLSLHIQTEGQCQDSHEVQALTSALCLNTEITQQLLLDTLKLIIKFAYYF